jgi:hypothetical protein
MTEHFYNEGYITGYLTALKMLESNLVISQETGTLNLSALIHLIDDQIKKFEDILQKTYEEEREQS